MVTYRTIMGVRLTRARREVPKRWGFGGLGFAGPERALEPCIVSCKFLLLFSFLVSAGCSSNAPSGPIPTDTEQERLNDRWQGFWLGQSIGNWTGLVTEMDKIGGEGSRGQFYTRDDWGSSDQPAIWSDLPSEISPTIDFVLRRPGETWGADDDTDIEYMYLFTMDELGLGRLDPESIRDAWLAHIYNEQLPTPYGKDGEVYQNYLWVSNQAAHELMLSGVRPPQTAAPANNAYGEMIDAQLTTEIFGLLAPAQPDVALNLAYFPIRTAGYGDAVLAAEFYVVLHALVAGEPRGRLEPEQLMALALNARQYLPDDSTPAAMFDFVLMNYRAGLPWEVTRDRIYERYQVQQADGYDMSRRGLYCNGCFASGINFAASLISFFYGEGDFQKTMKIAVLTGWDADNPAATWGGLLGFSIGRERIEAYFGGELSDRFNIHRTRKGFPNKGIDNFDAMAVRAMRVSCNVVEASISEPKGRSQMCRRLLSRERPSQDTLSKD